MKKVFDQTVRDLKREVNKKVLKVPGIEQKVLDATSNEPWGPHGSLLADIAQATRNYHEYQMIMAVLWKRINDTGKNWRHVYKALTVLEYLVANGSERVIDDIREHAYQISTLSNFQYIDSSGRDQGNNVRKKSQSLVALVNDKERIVEVRQKASANRDKFRNMSSAGGMYRPGYSSSGGYGDRYNDDDRYESRYGSRDDDRYGYGREKEYRDDDRYTKNGDSYSRDGDRYGRDYEDRYGRENYKDDDYRGRGRSFDDYHYGSRGRSEDRDPSLDNDSHSSRGSNARVEDSSVDGRRLDRKYSEQNLDKKLPEQNAGAPPSYEEALSESRSPVHSEREGDASVATAPRASSPTVNASPVQENAVATRQEIEPFEEFDPRSNSAALATLENAATTSPNYASPTVSNNAEVDLFGSLSDSFSSNTLAIMPTVPATAESEAHANPNPGLTFPATSSASDAINQSFEDPFGDVPFRAVPSTENSLPLQDQNAESHQPVTIKVDNTSNYDFGDSFSSMNYPPSGVSTATASSNSQFLPQEPTSTQLSTDILAGILPPFESSSGLTAQGPFSAPAGELAPQGDSVSDSAHTQMGSMVLHPHSGSTEKLTAGFLSQGVSVPPINSQMSGSTNMVTSLMAAQQPSSRPRAQFDGENLFHQQVYGTSVMGASQMAAQPSNDSSMAFDDRNLLPQQGFATPAIASSQMVTQPQSVPASQLNGGNFYPTQGSPAAPQPSSQMTYHPAGPVTLANNGNLLPQQGSAALVSPHAAVQTTTGPASQPGNDVFGNLFSPTGTSPSTTLQPTTQPNLPSSSGSPYGGIQSSKDKFETKSTIWSDTLSRGLVNLNISGPKINPLADIGIDFDALNRKEKRMEKPAANPVTSTVTMGKAMGSGSGLGRAGASALRPASNPLSSGMGMGMGAMPGAGMGVGMGGVYGGTNQPMGMGQGPMQYPAGLPPGSMRGVYNPMMGSGGYPQQPYGGGYR